MIKRLLFLLLALILAWIAGPTLTEFLSFLPIEGLVNLLVPDDLTTQTFKTYMTVLIWAAIFFLAFRSFGLPLGFLWPSFSSRSSSKFARRVQGTLAEMFLLGLFFSVPLFLYHAVFFDEADYIKNTSRTRTSTQTTASPSSIFENDSEVKRNIEYAKKNLVLTPYDSLYFDIDFQFQKFIPRREVEPTLGNPAITQMPSMFYQAYYQTDIDYLKSQADYMTQVQILSDPGRNVDKNSIYQELDQMVLGYIHAGRINFIVKAPDVDSGVFTYKDEIKYGVNQVKNIFDPIETARNKEIRKAIRQRIAYEKGLIQLFNKNLRAAQNRIQNANQSVLKSKARAENENHQSRLARFNNQSGIARFLESIFYSFRRSWFLCALVAFVGLILVHRHLRAEVSEVFTKFLRFIGESRLGGGGSMRFAGAFEEWGLLLNHRVPGATFGMIPGLNFLFGTMFKTLVENVGAKRFGDFLQKGFSTKPDLSNCALFVGRSLYNPFLNIALRDDRHMLTIAGSRSGKGVTAIIPNLLLWEGSTIVIDPKGTNAAVTARRRREMGQDVHLIDPFGIVEKDPKKRATFNPLEGLDPNSDTIRETISSIVEALVVVDPNQKDKHWDEGAKTVLTGLIGHLISDPRYKDQAYLGTIRDMLSMDPEEQTELWADMSMNISAGNTAKEAASRIVRGIGTDEMLSIFSNADKHTEWLSSEAMQATLGRSSFSFSDLKKRPTTIYLILPPHFLETHKRFLRLFINLTISHMSMGGRSKVPVLMMLDEFLALGYMKEVEKAFGLMAGYNLVMWPFVQDFGRLKDLYQNSVNSFVTNSRAVQVFGVSDEGSTEFVSKMIGNRTLDGSGTSKRTVPLREPSEVAFDVAADSGRQYILRAGKAPLLLEKVRYFDSDLLQGNYPGPFQDKYDPDPDFAG